ncbi:response regulator [Pelagicoccus enzymogenes]|uniref:response regulator n=1 Tax=Pelagicoccus enzymogenes TaxID=2773457 RepID=UPI00280C7790|nr:response regulator [Pelagicoccus enzymogenes]MDQ8196718.1 response regulator [Pelagicoccus enzymogenes]
MRDCLKRLLPRKEGDLLPDLPSLRERFVELASAYTLAFAFPLELMIIYRGLTVHWGWSTTVQTSVFLVLVCAVLLRAKLGVKATSAIVICCIVVAGLSGIVAWGLFASGPIVVVGFAVIAAVMLGTRWSLAIVALATAVTLFIGERYTNGDMSYRFDAIAHLNTISPWVNRALHLGMIGDLVCLVVSWMTKSLQRSILTLQAREEELEHSNQQLTQQAVQLEEQAVLLAEERDRAQIAARAKDQFLSIVSHELRTPLNPVIGFLDILQKERNLSEESRHQIELMQQSSEQLLKLIDQIVDFSELDRGELTFSPAPTSLSELEKEAVETLTNLAKLNRLDLKVATTGNPEQLILVDKQRISQVITELGTNAIRFTTQGRVTLNIELHQPNTDPNAKLRILVSDTGVGISPEKRKSIFDPFIQAENDRTRSSGGLGLGLSFCQQMLKSMDGTLELQSEVGVGTRAIVEVPVQALSEKRPSTPKPPLSKKLKLSQPLEVLVVEDNYTNQRVVTTLLKRIGAKAVCAENGQVALELLDRQSYDVVLMDLSMPVMDGITASREIRLRPHLDKLPIIALTAHSYRSSEKQCREAGMNGFLTKPVNKLRLFEALSQACPHEQEALVASTATASPS